jgi:hypothetical protein
MKRIDKKYAFFFYRFINFKKILCFILLLTLFYEPIKAQNIEAKIIAYNTLVGGLSGAIGAAINRKKDQKWHKAFAKGFIVGLGGGAVVYCGKKLNGLVAQKQNLGYCWLSRAVFSAGNSIVENAAANRDFWSQWHYDVGFVRLEFKTGPFTFIPRFMPSTFAGIAFMASNGDFDYNTSLQSGSITFRTDYFWFAPNLVASTMSNGFLVATNIKPGKPFYDTYAHEMTHAFQFQEFSGCNAFFNPVSDKWKLKSPAFKKISKWVYGDFNYELMLANYFFIQRGYKDKLYCRNYLENEAEHLSTGKSACDQ